MSNLVHREGDMRTCGASTVSAGQDWVRVDGQLVAVDGDPNSHGGGALIAATNEVYIDGVMVVNVGDAASPDDLCPSSGGAHCLPSAASGADWVVVGD